MNVVELTTPTDFSTENHPASTNLYEGLPGINQLLAIYRQGHVCADVEAIPLPQDYTLTPSDNTPVPNNKNPTANRTNTTKGGPTRRDRPASASARAVPYPAPSVDRRSSIKPAGNMTCGSWVPAPQGAGRSAGAPVLSFIVKFTVPEHKNISDMVQAWRTAVRNTLPPHNKSKSPWGYFVPEASMLTAPHKKETIYLMNWLKIRVDWLLMMMDDKHRHLTTSSGWREYLAFCDGPRKEKHANVLRKMKEVWNIYSKDLARRASKWGGRELRVEDLDLRTWREITWKLCQIGFQYELWALDSIIVRREGPHALDIAAERNRWINKVCGDDWLTRTEEQLTAVSSIGSTLSIDASMAKQAQIKLSAGAPADLPAPSPTVRGKSSAGEDGEEVWKAMNVEGKRSAGEDGEEVWKAMNVEGKRSAGEDGEEVWKAMNVEGKRSAGEDGEEVWKAMNVEGKRSAGEDGEEVWKAMNVEGKRSAGEDGEEVWKAMNVEGKRSAGEDGEEVWKAMNVEGKRSAGEDGEEVWKAMNVEGKRSAGEDGEEGWKAMNSSIIPNLTLITSPLSSPSVLGLVWFVCTCVRQAGLSGVSPVGQAGLSGAPDVEQAGLSGVSPVGQAGLSGAPPVGQAGLSGAPPVGQAGLSGTPPVGQAGLSGTPPVGQAALSGAPDVEQAALSGAPEFPRISAYALS
ncbi:hypothetical protein BC629DRAFT_1597972 [Irpex lacteus]|nr:hypothetical protein BC629DRAFT_1597972 [Irpex lacteus]